MARDKKEGVILEGEAIEEPKKEGLGGHGIELQGQEIQEGYNINFSSVKDLEDYESYPEVRKYREALATRKPFYIAFMDSYALQYTVPDYPYDSIFVFKGHGEIDLLDPITAERLEITQRTNVGKNAFLEAIANGMFIIGINDIIDAEKYRFIYKQKLKIRQDEILKMRQQAAAPDVKVSPYQPENGS